METTKKKILVADDEADILRMAEILLTHAGYAVTAVGGGRDALAAVKKELPDLIILDVNMPDMDGGEVGQILKNDPKTKHIPVIYLTGLAPKTDSSRKDAFGNTYMAKPYSPNTLVDVVKKLLMPVGG